MKSAEDFVKCINKLTDNEELKLSKEMIKKLFSIEAEKDVAQSLFLETIHRPVVSREIAELFECPDVRSHRIFFLINSCSFLWHHLISSEPLKRICAD